MDEESCSDLDRRHHPTCSMGLDHLLGELVQVSVFLAAFSGLYFAVYAVTDETYRSSSSPVSCASSSGARSASAPSYLTLRSR